MRRRRWLSYLISIVIIVIILILWNISRRQSDEFKDSTNNPDQMYSKAPLTFSPIDLSVHPPELLEERQFPLAFSIVTYRDVGQTKRLLKAIYRPFNYYCIHVDLGAKAGVWRSISKWPKEFPEGNVIVPNERVKVVHSAFSVLEADLICIRELVKHSKKWKYLINLTGQEWPLKNNLELVRILKALNGSNLMEKITINPDRVPSDAPAPPHSITLWKGAVHIVVTRQFVDFMLNDQRSKDLLQYIEKYIVIPDESYFSTLNHNPHLKAPGGYLGTDMTNDVHYPQLMRLKHWAGQQPCHGVFRRDICIWGWNDLSYITSPERKQLFVNKFIIGQNDRVLDAVEHWFLKRQTEVYAHTNKNIIDLSYYTNLYQVKNHS